MERNDGNNGEKKAKVFVRNPYANLDEFRLLAFIRTPGAVNTDPEILRKARELVAEKLLAGESFMPTGKK